MFLSGITADQLETDILRQRGIERSMEIVGEAVRQLKEFYPEIGDEIPWTRSIVSLRNRLAHAYFSVDYEVLWDIASSEVPALRALVVQLLTEKGDEQH
mgnify:CR=1 FL=1